MSVEAAIFPDQEFPGVETIPKSTLTRIATNVGWGLRRPTNFAPREYMSNPGNLNLGRYRISKSPRYIYKSPKHIISKTAPTGKVLKMEKRQTAAYTGSYGATGETRMLRAVLPGNSSTETKPIKTQEEQRQGDDERKEGG